MRPKIKFFLLQICVLALIALLSVDHSRADTDLVEITGVVLVVELFEVYGATAVMIAGDDGEMYVVSNNDRGAELVGHENQTVKVSGTVTIGANGGKTITVERYQILEQYKQSHLNI